jgi:hypothetical protein
MDLACDLVKRLPFDNDIATAKAGKGIVKLASLVGRTDEKARIVGVNSKLLSAFELGSCSLNETGVARNIVSPPY